jgi:hypothetical protein
MVIEVRVVGQFAIDNLHRPPPGSQIFELIHPTGESFATWEEQFGTAFAGGGSRCLVCRTADGENAVKAVARAAAEADRRLPQEQAELSAAVEPEDIARLILDGDERIPVAVYQGAWVKLVAAGAIASDAELVDIGEPSRFFGRTPRERSRRPAWKVPGDYRWLDEAAGCWERTPAQCYTYAVKPGCPVYYKTRISEVNVDGVLGVSDGEHLQSAGVAGIKKIVSGSRLTE